MHSMLRQNQIRLQDIKSYVRTCDRQNELGPEEWAKQEANAFAPGTLVFLLEPAKRPPGLTSFAAKSQQANQPQTSDTFRVKDLSVVVDRVEDKAWVLNVTPSAYELRFLDTLFKEKAMKAILEGIDFNYLIATPRKTIDENGLKEIRQLANIYSEGGSRRSLSQDPSGPEEPAKAILGFLGVDWSQGGNKPVIELGAVCHLIFAPEGQEESPLRNAIKGSFTPILPNEAVGQTEAEQDSAPPAPATPEPPQNPLESIEGLKPVSAKQASVFAPMDLNKSVSEGKGDQDQDDSIFAPVDGSKQEPTKPEESPDLSASAFAPISEPKTEQSEEFQSSSHPAGSLMTPETPEEAPEELPTSADAPQETPQEQSDEFVPAWYLLTHDLEEMKKVGKEKADLRRVPTEPEEKVDYSNQFFSDFEKGDTGSKAQAATEQQMLDDFEKDAAAVIAADADQAVEMEHFNDSIFAESGAKGSLEANPDAKLEEKPKAEDKPATTKPPAGPGIKAPEELQSADSTLFEKLATGESPPVVLDDSKSPDSDAKSASGPPTNLMDMLTADSDVFTTTSAKPGMKELQEGTESENYNDLADALNGLIDSDSIPKAVEQPPAQSPGAPIPAPNLFNMDMPEVLSESSQAGSPPAEAPQTPAPSKMNLFDDDEFEEDLDNVALEADEHVSQTSEISAIKFRPELTLTEGAKEESEADQPEAIIPESPFADNAVEAEAAGDPAAIPDKPFEAPAPEPEPIVTEAPAPEPEPIVTEAPAPEPEPIVTEPPAPEPIVTEAPAPEPEPIVTEAPAPEPETIVTEPPAPEPEPIVTEASAPEPEPIVTEPPAPEPIVTEAPAPEPEPIVTEAPAPEPEPIVTEPPAPEPEPIVTEAPLPEPEPIVTEAPAPEPEPIVTEPPAPEPEPIVTEPPAPEPEPIVTEAPAPEPEPIVTEAPAPEPEPIVTEAPAPEPEPIVTEAPLPEPEPIVTEAPAPEPEPIVTEAPAPEPEPIVTQSPAAEQAPVTMAAETDEASLFPHKPEQEEEPAEELEEKKAKAPLLKPSSKRRSRIAARRAQPEPVSEEPQEEEAQVPQGPTLEPKLALSESARFMARLNQRLSEADKKLASKSDQAKENYANRVSEHIDKAYQVERDRANNSLGLAAKLTRELEGVASQVKTRIEETSKLATEELNQVIQEAEQEIEQVKQELVSTLRYAEHRARSDSDSLQDDSSKKLDNHIQERTQEFSERTEYVCGLLEEVANEHINIAEKRFERFKTRMHEELDNILSSLERNVNSMNEEIDGSWDRASIKLLANQKEFENTANHLIRNCQLNLESRIKLVYVEQILPKLVDNKAIFRTMLFDMKKNYEEQSDRIITEHLTGLESNIKNAQEELKTVVAKCYSSIEETGKGQQSGLEELYDNTSARMVELTNQVSTKLEKARTTLEKNQTACNQVADYGKEKEDPTLAEERTQTRATLQSVRRDAERRLETAINNGCSNLEGKSENLNETLTNKREEWTNQVKQSSEVGVSKIKRAIQEAYQAIDQAKDDFMD